jgi:hypothetical protein
LPLCLIKHYAMDAYGIVGVQNHVFLTSALASGEWSASSPGRFNPRGNSHRYADPRSGLEDVEKRKFLALPGLEIKSLGRLARNQSVYRLVI